MTMANVAMTMNTSSQPDMSGSSRKLRDLGFPLVGFLASVHSRGNGVLLAGHDFLAALDQIFRALAQFASLFLRVVPAFFRFGGQIFARFFAGFRGEKNSHQRADSQPDHKEANLRTHVVAHKTPPNFRLA